MSETLKFGNGKFAVKEGSALAYNDENGNFKPLPFTFDRSTSATRVNKQGLIEVVSNNEPRIDFLNDSKGALLLEPSRTNSITYSNDFSQSIYGKINLTITANQGISPDGTQNANLLVPNAAVGNRYLTNSTGSNLKINTVFLKKKELRYVKVGNAQSNVLVDLENGTISADSVSTNNFTIENYGNGWYRVSCYNTLDVNLQIQIFFGIDGSGSNIATNGTDGVYIYGFEIQNGSYATSYIPTQGSIGTRVAESCNQTPPSGIIGQTEGTIYIQLGQLEENAINEIYLELNNGSGSPQRIGIYSDGSGFLRNLILGGGDSSTIQTNYTPQSNDKIAITYKTNEAKIFVNGIQRGGTDITVGVPATSILSLQVNTSNRLQSIQFRDVKLYNTALTDQELILLTS